MLATELKRQDCHSPMAHKATDLSRYTIVKLNYDVATVRGWLKSITAQPPGCVAEFNHDMSG